jgi:hypothetical protein
VLALVLLAAIVVFAFYSWQHPSRAPAPVAPNVPAVSLPGPTPTASLVTAWTPEVRRAEPVPVTVRRAALLRLPTQEIGVYKWCDLPSVWGGGRVWARYMGTVGRFPEIPLNPVPGDLWNITETGAGWIYFTPAGYSQPAWIDPLSVRLRRFANRYTNCVRPAASTRSRHMFGNLSLRASTRNW